MQAISATVFRATAARFAAQHAAMTASTSRSPVLASPLSHRCRGLTISRAQQQKTETLSNGNDLFKEDEIVFKPMQEGKEQLQQVSSAEMNSSEIDDSFARLNYHVESEVGVNEQINHEYTMSYQYHAMGSYFARDNVGLPGFAAFYRASSLEERTHAQQLMNFQATRGGRVKLAALGAPRSDYNHEEKGDALFAMELTLALEKLNFKLLMDLHETAEKHNDAQMSDFVEDMLAEQAGGVKEISEYVAQLRRVGKGLGVYEFDKFLAGKAVSMGSVDATTGVTPGAIE